MDPRNLGDTPPSDDSAAPGAPASNSTETKKQEDN
jgi:hypothetical protein